MSGGIQLDVESGDDQHNTTNRSPTTVPNPQSDADPVNTKDEVTQATNASRTIRDPISDTSDNDSSSTEGKVLPYF